jgi:hypothetical protein
LNGHSGLFNSLAFYWPEQNVTLVGTINTNQPPPDYVYLMIDAMFAMQEYVIE